MKKLTFLVITISLLSQTSFKSRAQGTMNGQKESLAFGNALLADPAGSITEARNLKAEKKFMQAYPYATRVEWSALKNKSRMCRFYIDNILNRAFYSNKGQWLGTVSSYDGGKLNKDISDKIRSAYFDYSIVFVNQIDMVNNKAIYIVEIQNQKSIKKIRFDNDEMEVIQEFEKN